MSKLPNVICCEQCFDEIARKSPSAARLWLDLCVYGHMHDLLTLDGSDTPEIRWLEILGYLRSTETDKQILIKMEGEGETEDGEVFFCCWEEKHG